ncbi:MAG: hypothetical protein H0A75_05680 [Candidatus Methanofishera endochildressiae]|uniref:Uncharacterized protein n=1 Tax=Candidatus Methanofishera endochildressiae TaxID=2738884 RepID=A0A7Z0MP47_9GAMM|nr:hypothetical protein [Candidatus Methanofishera endochildressiae]
MQSRGYDDGFLRENGHTGYARLVRLNHGQTQKNANRLFGGQIDYFPGDLGAKQYSSD